MNFEKKESNFLKNNKNSKKHNEKEKLNENENNSTNNIEKLNQTILEIKKNISDIKLREQAEIENIKKYADKRIQDIKTMQLQHFYKNLIPILDDLINISNNTCQLNVKNNKIIEGISLTVKLLLETTKKFGLVLEKTVNIKFNPSLHEIESNKNINDIHSYVVSSIIKTGYIFQGTVIRKATVKIQKLSL
ncbi:MAG: nucleotide exchange factor GrpE [Buchnera aphidicola (Schlechtendalia peitan)]